jgi:ribosomal protein L11 methyltransferase
LTPRWAALLAEVPIGLEDEISFSIGRDSLGVEVVPAAAGRSLVRVYWAAVEGRAPSIAAAADALRAFGLDPAACALRVEPVEDGRWVERYQAALAPMPVGARFVVVPGAARPEPSERVEIRVVPGMAFGTGEHPTTRQCVAALESVVAPGSRWLDLGCGTGILAIAAKLLGAGEVVAVDVDPAAVEVAREAAALNGVGDAIDVREGSIDLFAGAEFDGIVANIAASFFLRHAAPIAAALAGSGRLVASGFLVEDVPELREALAAVGLRLVVAASEGPWACVGAQKARRAP